MTELTEKQKNEAQRLFMLRRRIFDDANIKDGFDNAKEYDFPWGMTESVDFTDLSDQDIFMLVLILYSIREFGVPAHIFKGVLEWSKYKVYKLAKNEKFIYPTTLVREDDGLIAGKGYVIERSVQREMDRLYEEFLWHDGAENTHYGKLFMLDVDIPNIYRGKTKGVIHKDGGFQIFRPEYIRYNGIPNWPREGQFPKSVLDIKSEYVKRWKIIY